MLSRRQTSQQPTAPFRSRCGTTARTSSSACADSSSDVVDDGPKLTLCGRVNVDPSASTIWEGDHDGGLGGDPPAVSGGADADQGDREEAASGAQHGP